MQAWATQKKSAVIKAGLNPSCSKIQPHYFNLLRNHTNSVEQSHQKSYASGKFLTLVEAVRKYLSITYQLLGQTLLTILVLRNLIKMIFFNIKVFSSSMFTIHIELLQWRQIICVIWVGKVSYFKYLLSSWQVLSSIINNIGSRKRQRSSSTIETESQHSHQNLEVSHGNSGSRSRSSSSQVADNE